MVNVNALKAARVRCGLSQGRMASALGIRQNRYNPMENGKSAIPLPMIGKIVRILGLSRQDVDTIFMLDDIYSNCKNESSGVYGDTRQVHVDGCVVVYAMYSCCFWIEIRLFRCRAVNQKPAHRIGDGGFSETVRSVNVRVFAVEVDGKFLDSSEIREREAQNLHVVPPLGLEISMRFMYNLRRLFSRCFGRIPYGVRGLKRCSSGRKNLHGERLTLANAWVSRFSFAHKSFFVRRL